MVPLVWYGIVPYIPYWLCPDIWLWPRSMAVAHMPIVGHQVNSHIQNYAKKVWHISRMPTLSSTSLCKYRKFVPSDFTGPISAIFCIHQNQNSPLSTELFLHFYCILGRTWTEYVVFKTRTLQKFPLDSKINVEKDAKNIWVRVFGGGATLSVLLFENEGIRQRQQED